MKVRALALAVAAALVASPAAAQTAPGPGIKFGLDATGTIPVGNFADFYGIGLGGLLRVEFLPIPGVAITGRAGYIHHLTKDLEGDAGHVKLGELPILAGVKVYSPVGIYGALELGGTWLNPSIEAGTFGGTDFDSASFKFSGTVGLGFATGPVDVRGGLNIVDIGNIGDTMQVGISLGFNFISI